MMEIAEENLATSVYLTEKFEVDKITKKGIDENGKTYYKIKWARYPESQSTWEPIDNLSDISDLIQLYELELKKRFKKYMTTPIKVNYAKYFKNKLYVNISWKEPEDTSVVVPDMMVAYEEIREKHPQLLIEYYEKRLKYGDQRIEIFPDSTCVLK